MNNTESLNIERSFRVHVYDMRRRKLKPEESSTTNGGSSPPGETNAERMKRIFGFDWSDFVSWEAFMRLMHSPRDPSSLGVTRILFGIMMFLDIFQERGLAFADDKWGDTFECRFPLFDFLTPLPLQWMIILYLVMLTGAVGVILGLFYRFSLLIFIIPYWYIFALDKTVWNNHSYLYGVISTLLLFMDGNRFWSLDGLLNKNKRNAHTPLWNIALLRFQIFLVYFYAGLKKTEKDWLTGYSMDQLSENWVFAPFRLFMTNEQVDLYIVHICGFTLDLTIGFFLFFDVTRPIAMFFGAQFHLMNSTMFSIGMFPWTMLATLPLFCYCDWPRPIFKYISQRVPILVRILPLDEEPQPNYHCIYPKEEVKPENQTKEEKTSQPSASKVIKSSSSRFYHRAVFMGVFLHCALQLFLPYSHFITKGYNNWTNGLYGYSWDMMVHSWRSQHVRITYVSKETGDTGYLNYKAFTQSKRWCSHADMLKQISTCIEDRLASHYGMKHVELYFDVWKSVNKRFQQRKYDPKVNILEAEWHPFKDSPWNMPLLADLSDWRSKLAELEKTIYDESNDTDVVFVADFPGLHLENYVQPDYGNTSIQVLNGQVMVEVRNGKNHTLNVGDKLQLPAGKFHTVYTTSETPSCYMYIYVNTTDVEFMKHMTEVEKKLQSENKTADSLPDKDPKQSSLKQALIEKQKREEQASLSAIHKIIEYVKKSFKSKSRLINRSASLSLIGLKATVLNQPIDDLFTEFLDSQTDESVASMGEEDLVETVD